jgi:hypothetical protein
MLLLLQVMLVHECCPQTARKDRCTQPAPSITTQTQLSSQLQLLLLLLLLCVRCYCRQWCQLQRQRWWRLR